MLYNNPRRLGLFILFEQSKVSAVIFVNLRKSHYTNLFSAKQRLPKANTETFECFKKTKCSRSPELYFEAKEEKEESFNEAFWDDSEFFDKTQK